MFDEIKKNNSSVRTKHIYVQRFMFPAGGLPPIWSSGQPILLSWLLTESVSLTRGTKMVSLIHYERHK